MSAFSTWPVSGLASFSFLSGTEVVGMSSSSCHSPSTDAYSGISDPLSPFRARLDMLYHHFGLIGRPNPFESAWRGMLGGNVVCLAHGEGGDDTRNMPFSVSEVMRLIREGSWVPAFQARNRIISDAEILLLLTEIASAIERGEMFLDRQMENFLRSTRARIKDSRFSSRIAWEPALRSIRDLLIEEAWKSTSTSPIRNRELEELYDRLYDMMSSETWEGTGPNGNELSLLEVILIQSSYELNTLDLIEYILEIWEENPNSLEDVLLRGGRVASAVQDICNDSEIPKIVERLPPDKARSALLTSARQATAPLLETFLNDRDWFESAFAADPPLHFKPVTLNIFLKRQKRSPQDDVATVWRKLHYSCLATKLAVRGGMSADLMERRLVEINEAILSTPEDLRALQPILSQIIGDVITCIETAHDFYRLEMIRARADAIVAGNTSQRVRLLNAMREEYVNGAAKILASAARDIKAPGASLLDRIALIRETFLRST